MVSSQSRAPFDGLDGSRVWVPAAFRSSQPTPRTGIVQQSGDSLSDIHKAYGFPAAPEMKPGTDEEIEEDLRLFALGANRNHEFYYYGANGSGDMGPEVGNKISTALPASTFGMVPLQANGHHSARHGNHYVAHHYHHYH